MRTVSRHAISRRGFVLGLAAGTVLGPGVGPAFAEGGRRARVRHRIRLTGDAVHVIEGGRAHRLRRHGLRGGRGLSRPRRRASRSATAPRSTCCGCASLPGVTGVDRFLSVGAGVRIGRIDVAAATQTAHPDERLAGFLQIRRPDVRIEAIRFRNIDRCVLIHRAADVWIGSFDCVSYCKGLRIDESSDVHVGRLAARKTSPHGGAQSRLQRPDHLRQPAPRACRRSRWRTRPSMRSISPAAATGTARTSGSAASSPGARGSAASSARRTGTRASMSRSTSSWWWTRPTAPGPAATRTRSASRTAAGSVSAGSRPRAEAAGRSCYAGVYLNGVTGFDLDGGRSTAPPGRWC